MRCRRKPEGACAVFFCGAARGVRPSSAGLSRKRGVSDTACRFDPPVRERDSGTSAPVSRFHARRPVSERCPGRMRDIGPVPRSGNTIVRFFPRRLPDECFHRSGIVSFIFSGPIFIPLCVSVRGVRRPGCRLRRRRPYRIPPFGRTLYAAEPAFRTTGPILLQLVAGY